MLLRSRLFILFAVLLSVGFSFYLMPVWLANPDFIHGICVAPLMLFLLWTQRDAHGEPFRPARLWLAGLASFAFFSLGFILAAARGYGQMHVLLFFTVA